MVTLQDFVVSFTLTLKFIERIKSCRLMIEYINDYADVSSDNDGNNDDIKNEKVDLDNFIDDTEIENNPSDFCGLSNVKRSFSDAEEDAFSESDIEVFLDEITEASFFSVLKMKRKILFHAQKKKLNDLV